MHYFSDVATVSQIHRERGGNNVLEKCCNGENVFIMWLSGERQWNIYWPCLIMCMCDSWGISFLPPAQQLYWPSLSPPISISVLKKCVSTRQACRKQDNWVEGKHYESFISAEMHFKLTGALVKGFFVFFLTLISVQEPLLAPYHNGQFGQRPVNVNYREMGWGQSAGHEGSSPGPHTKPSYLSQNAQRRYFFCNEMNQRNRCP